LSLSSEVELGRTLGKLKQEQEVTIKDNMSPVEEDALFNVWNSNFIRIEGKLVVNKLIYPTDSFVIDHPVYGYIDSPVLKIDGGYLNPEGEKIYEYEY
jgi:hypothetical protein